MSRFQEQVERLSPAQRAKLAEKLSERSSSTRLLAYVTPLSDEDFVDTDALKGHLESRLPAYMVPATIMELDELPQLPNGKVDRSKLPRPSIEPKALESSEALSELEAQLLTIWQDVLGFEEISIEDDFFEIGGDSILAMQLLVSIQTELELAPEENLSSADLLNCSTIAKMATHLGAREAPTYECLVPIQEKAGATNLFCTHVRGGQVLFYKKMAQHITDVSIYGLQPIGVTGNTEPLLSFKEMAARYIEEMRSLQPEGPYHILGYCTGAALAFEIAQQLRQAGAIVGQVILVDPTFSESILKVKSFAPFRRFYRNFLIQGGNVPAVYTVLRDFFVFRIHLLEEAITAQFTSSEAEEPTLEERMNQAFDRAFSEYALSAYSDSVVFISSHETRIWDQCYLLKGLVDYWREYVHELEVISMSCMHTEFFEEPYVATLAEMVRKRVVSKNSSDVKILR